MVSILNNVKKEDLAKSLVTCDLATRLYVSRLKFAERAIHEQAIYYVLICLVFQSTSVHTKPQKERNNIKQWNVTFDHLYIQSSHTYWCCGKKDHHDSQAKGGEGSYWTFKFAACMELCDARDLTVLLNENSFNWLVIFFFKAETNVLCY